MQPSTLEQALRGSWGRPNWPKAKP
ncbi:hypothetical protein CFIO01_13756 [Colletotrichum fioriniae PJ7]|uniref:Uncharacterized protein n=1 Tax=Colletotrichum fioriniae PJ7 TaxID=1445577 RepID=A0A010RIP0_9PEZI|nr:hypothetical protein CFIO01_13756 [Colletotrichum fioriniae PJ7]